METPRNLRSYLVRTPTPKLSERKKALFTTGKNPTNREEIDIVPYKGNSLLLPRNNQYEIDGCSRRALWVTVTGYKSKGSKNCNVSSAGPPVLKLGNGSDHENIDDLKNVPDKSDLITLHNIPRTPDQHLTDLNDSTYILSTTNDLDKLFQNSLKIDEYRRKSLVQPSSIETTTDGSKNCSSEFKVSNESPQRKQRKLEIAAETRGNTENKEKSVQSLDDIVISTKSFYSAHPVEIKSNSTKDFKKSSSHLLVPTKQNYKINKDTMKTQKKVFNRGVMHKVRKPIHQYKKPYSFSKKSTIEKIVVGLRNHKLRNPPSQRLQRDAVEKVHRFLRSMEEPLQISRPLLMHSENAFTDFSISSSENSDDGDKSSELGILETNKKRRFFKSGKTAVKKEFLIANKVKGTLSNSGRVMMMPHKSRRRNISASAKILDRFSTEHAEINEIINTLYKTNTDTIVPRYISEREALVNDTELAYFESEDNKDAENYSEFKNRIPYNTSSTEVIEKQKLLLDFLISYNICTEQNFTIFIADPENHKDEAAQIVDSLVICIPLNPKIAEAESSEHKLVLPHSAEDSHDNLIFKENSFQNLELAEIYRESQKMSTYSVNSISTTHSKNDKVQPFPTLARSSSPIIPKIFNVGVDISCTNDCESNNRIEGGSMDAHEIRSLYSNEYSQSIIKNPLKECNKADKGFFPIFYPSKCKEIVYKSTRKRISTNLRGFGINQYQLDAGQREFGAKQCIQCGLIYTMHEPEEEELHNSFHNSLHILKFKGWIDEDIVETFPEWGKSGRIICVSDRSRPKHKERVLDILQIVDKELGFSVDFIPDVFIAFVAVKKRNIVGFCLTVPLTKANRFVVINGVDCCTEEFFHAKCGISRIWVSPLHRRERIGCKLIKAVKTHTIPDEVLSTDEIAFSAPTTDGKAFAVKICGRSDFLVYQ